MQCMRIFPLALICAACLFLIVQEMRGGAGEPVAQRSALSSR